jgi:UDP-N-acetylglucosamine transferase subunit ALG13
LTNLSSSPESENSSVRRPRICLAASGGGHLRQLIDLAPVWSPYDHFFVTEDTALSRSLPDRVHFVPHFAAGQGRQGKPLRMLAAAARNFVRSTLIIMREKPDFVISTGAGSVFFALLWSRLVGARIVVIESLARFERLSAFARAAGPLAHHKVVQSPALSAAWPDAAVFDPLLVLNTPVPSKASLLFATVGATLPFERLVAAVVSLKQRGIVEEEVIVQRGVGAPAPADVASFETAPFQDMLEIMHRARIVVCHGGTGSLITALREGCHVIAMPRRFADSEHYDDHQNEITRAFEARGLIQIAHTEPQLLAALRRLNERTPSVATSDYRALIAHLTPLIEAEAHRYRGRPHVPWHGGLG